MSKKRTSPYAFHDALKKVGLICLRLAVGNMIESIYTTTPTVAQTLSV
ncbi:hypothetical protein U9I39_09060 [Lacticaseibacillus rhamnosus]|nr:hypothetical protein [Lacticaseibacillus rhamnosus]